MTGCFEIQIKQTKIMFVIRDTKRGLSVRIENKETKDVLYPTKVRQNNNRLVLITVFFMEPDLEEKAMLEFKNGCYMCSGRLAVIGEIAGCAVSVSARPGYQKMLRELTGNGNLSSIHRSEGEIKQAVETLLSQMTLAEKIGQMSQTAGDNTQAIGEKIKQNQTLEQSIANGKVGSLIAVTDIENLYEYQKIAVGQSRLGIPLFFCQDVIHGFQTIFPVPLAWACSFNPALVEEANRIAAIEATENGIMYAFAPMLDIARDPRWGRVVEGAGEDPYLASMMAEAQVKGYQGTDVCNNQSMLACLKHFIGYSAAEGGRDYNTAEVSRYTLENLYLVPFRAGIRCGAASVMSSFNTINGIPSVINQEIGEALLREELGFEGILISDYAAVAETIVHGAAEDGMDAAIKAVKATTDIEMGTGLYNSHLEDAVINGEIREENLDACVRRILYYKYKTGLMDDPYRYMRMSEKNTLFCPEHLECSRKLAAESIVLLKNDGVLPLKEKDKIAVIGPMGDSIDLLGPWNFSKYKEETVTLLEGLQAKGLDVICEPGCSIDSELDGGIERAVMLAAQADVVLLALGESSDMSGEAASRQNIKLPSVQMELAEAIYQTGTPFVLILTNGRPLILNWFEKFANGILETWFLGSQAGNAIADVLTGDFNPSGKTAISFPAHIGQIPIYYNHLATGRPGNSASHNRFTSRYLDGSNEPLYPFGYGLSYTQFEIRDFSLQEEADGQNGGLITARLKVKNAGTRKGTEVVQLYIRDVSASVARPVKELKGIKRITLDAGGEANVYFIIKEKDLGFYDIHGQWLVEPGKFEVKAGNSSRDMDLTGSEFILEGSAGKWKLKYKK